MTEPPVQTNFESDPYDDDIYSLGNIKPVPVVMAGTLTQNKPPQFAGCQTFPVPIAGVNLPVQVLQRNERRDEAQLWLSSLANGPSQYSKSTYNQTVAPGANATLANFSGGGALPAGFYSITASVYFGPATAPVDGTDNDNFVLNVDGVSTGHIMIPATQSSIVTVVYPSVFTNGTNISIKSIIAGTALVQYRSSLVATALNEISGSIVVLSSRPDGLSVPNPQGFILSSTMAGAKITWDSSEPLYAIAIGAAAQISAIDQTYLTVQGSNRD
jgi:hypothetical protein